MRPPLSEVKIDDRAVGQPEFVELRADAADGGVHALHHGRVGGVGLLQAGAELVSILLHKLGGTFDAYRRNVDREVRQIEKERPILGSFDELHRLFAEPIGEIVAWFSFGERRDVPRSEIVLGDAAAVPAMFRSKP